MRPPPKDAKCCLGCGKQERLNIFSYCCRPCEKEIGFKVNNKEYVFVHEDQAN